MGTPTAGHAPSVTNVAPSAAAKQLFEYVFRTPAFSPQTGSYCSVQTSGRLISERGAGAGARGGNVTGGGGGGGTAVGAAFGIEDEGTP